MIVVGFWKILGVYFLYTGDFLYFRLDHCTVVMLPDFR